MEAGYIDDESDITYPQWHIPFLLCIFGVFACNTRHSRLLFIVKAHSSAHRWCANRRLTRMMARRRSPTRALANRNRTSTPIACWVREQACSGHNFSGLEDSNAGSNLRQCARKGRFDTCLSVSARNARTACLQKTPADGDVCWYAWFFPTPVKQPQQLNPFQSSIDDARYVSTVYCT